MRRVRARRRIQCAGRRGRRACRLTPPAVCSHGWQAKVILLLRSPDSSGDASMQKMFKQTFYSTNLKRVSIQILDRLRTPRQALGKHEQGRRSTERAVSFDVRTNSWILCSHPEVSLRELWAFFAARPLSAAPPRDGRQARTGPPRHTPVVSNLPPISAKTRAAAPHKRSAHKQYKQCSRTFVPSTHIFMDLPPISAQTRAAAPDKGIDPFTSEVVIQTNCTHFYSFLGPYINSCAARLVSTCRGARRGP